MSPSNHAVRAPSLVEFDRHPPTNEGGLRQWTARAQNFAVTYLQAEGAASSTSFASPDELLLLTLDTPLTVAGPTGAHEVAARAVTVLPPGEWRLTPAGAGRCVVIRSLREDADAPESINQEAYRARDERIVGVGAAYRRVRGRGEVQVMPIDAIQAPQDKPRLKMLQTATLSINWVEYQGPRNRTQLSPHAHASFEQGSLALAGEFVHHLRVPWNENAELWQDDRHARLGSPSLLVVPVGLVHTSEGVGEGPHLLIDVFSPPRADFIAKGWVSNAADYQAPSA